MEPPSQPYNPLVKPLVEPVAKRSKISPWNAAAAPRTSADHTPPSPQPARIVSDIAPPPVPRSAQFTAVNVNQQERKAVSGTPTTANMSSVTAVNGQPQRKASTHPKVAALQRHWEGGGAQAKSAEAFLAHAELMGGADMDLSDEDGDTTSVDTSVDPSSSSEDDSPAPINAAIRGLDSARRSSSHVPLPSYALSGKRPYAQMHSPPSAKRQSTGSLDNNLSLSRIEHAESNPAPSLQHMPPAENVPQAAIINCASSIGSDASLSDGWVKVNGKNMPIIDTSTGGRLYREFQEPSGTKISAIGSLIPDGYRLLDTSHSRWVCPVRGCKKRMKTLAALGGHFAAGHNKQAFNDNGDGTLSLVGLYMSSGKKSPAVVISKEPLPAGTSPPAEPSFPLAHTQNQRDDYTTASDSSTSKRIPRKAASARSERQAEKSVPESVPFGDAPVDENPIVYLNRFLAPDQVTPGRADIGFMSLLRRQRDLPSAWIQFHGGATLDTTHYACALAFITGDEVIDNPCSKWYMTGRLGSMCVKLPNVMSSEDMIAFSPIVTCVGCRYRSHLQRQTNTCDWNKQSMSSSLRNQSRSQESVQPMVPPSNQAEASLMTLANAAPKQDPQVQATPQLVANGLTTEERMELDAHSPRRLKQVAPHLVLASQPVVSQPVFSPPPFPQPTFTQPMFTQPTAAQPAAPEPHMERLANGGRQAHPDVIPTDDSMSRMEDWEFAPGRQVDPLSRETVAFSSVYLTGTQPHTIAEDISFNRLRIPPGGLHQWQADENSLRYCEVITGKVEVKFPETTLAIGPGGIFILRPGMSCTAENRRYVEAVLSCHTNTNYSFAK